MATGDSVNVDNCIFCKIITGKEEAKILYKDDDIIIIEDKFPAAKHHILVMPTKHIENAKHLKLEHKSLVEKMENFGLKQMKDLNADVEDMRSGINWPPLNTVKHLHQHFISPASSLSFFRSMLFSPKNSFFVNTQYILRNLK